MHLILDIFAHILDDLIFLLILIYASRFLNVRFFYERFFISTKLVAFALLVNSPLTLPRSGNNLLCFTSLHLFLKCPTCLSSYTVVIVVGSSKQHL